MPNDNDDIQTFYDGLFDKASGQIGDFSPSQFVPEPGYLLVREFERDTMTKGGLHLPSVAQEEKNVGVVLVVCPDEDGTDMGPGRFKPGDVVYFRALAGESLPFVGHENLRLLAHSAEYGPGDILGRFTLAEETSVV